METFRGQKLLEGEGGNVWPTETIGMGCTKKVRDPQKPWRLFVGRNYWNGRVVTSGPQKLLEWDVPKSGETTNLLVHLSRAETI